MKNNYPENYREERNYNRYEEDKWLEEENKELDLEGIGSDVLLAYFEDRETRHYESDDIDYRIYRF